MSTAASFRSWAPAKLKPGRNFLRENKLHVREIEKQHAGGGLQIEQHLHQHTHQPLWRPVQLIYPRERKCTFVPAYEKPSQVNRSIEPLYKPIKRCGLTDPHAAAASHECPMCSGGDIPSMPAAGISYSRQRDQQLQTEDIYDKQFLSNALKKCNAGQRIGGGDEGMPDDVSSNPPLSGRSRTSIATRHSQVSKHTNISKRTNVSHASKASNVSVTASKRSVSAASKGSRASAATLTDADKEKHMADSGNGLNDEHQTEVGIRQALTEREHAKHMSQGGEETRSLRSTKTRVSAGGNEQQRRKHRHRHHQQQQKPKQGDGDHVSLRSTVSNRGRKQSNKKCTHMLTERERIAALQTCNQRFNHLLKEYNRLPVSAQTLRVRNRKVDIEKELDAIEYEMNRYANPNAYARALPIW